MARIRIPLFPLLLAAACASAPTTQYWEHEGGPGTQPQFALDNEHCGAAATRITPTPPRASLPAHGAVAPDNRIDRPPHPWANGIAERAYMDCMAQRGWRVAAR